MSKNKDKNIIDVDMPQPKTKIEVFYAKLALAWKERTDEAVNDGKRLKAKISDLENKIERIRSDRDTEHQEYVALENETKQLSNEVDGLLRRETNIDKRVTAELMNEAAAHHKIDDAIAMRKPKTWIRLSWEIVAVLTIFLVVWQIGYNPEFNTFVSDNIFAIVVAVGILGYLAFRVFNEKKRK